MQFQIDNMTCGGCKGVTRAIHSVDPQAKVAIDLPMKRVTVESGADESSLLAALGHVGYRSRRTA